MKQIFKNFGMRGTALALTLVFIGSLMLTSCDGYTSVTQQEAYDAGRTIGRMIRGE